MTRDLGEIFSTSLSLYRTHFKALVLTAAVALVPVYVVHAGLTAALLPDTSNLEARSQRIAERERALSSLRGEDAVRAQQEILRDATATMAEAGGAIAGIGLFLLSMIIVVPLTIAGSFLGTAALMPLVDDRVRGGGLTPGGAWAQVGRRFVPLVVTALIASVAVVIASFFFVVPGILLAGLFAFAAPVAMLEKKSGVAALKRSAQLVLANLLPTAAVLIGLGLLTLIARLIGGVLIPSHWVFLHTLVRDAVSLVVFPLPVTGLVLLFHEARQPSAPAAHLGAPLAAH